jgi:ribonuclease HI
MLLHRGIGSNWGTSPAITLWFYTGIVRPALGYGSAVWAKSTIAKRRIKKVNTVQRLGMLMVAPIRLKTPTTGLEIALGIPPLHLYIRNLAIRTYNRLNLSPKGWPGAIRRGKTQGHIRWLETCTESLPLREVQDQCVFHKWSNLFHTFIGDGEDATHENGLRFYTDGSGREIANGSGKKIATGSGLAAYRGVEPEPIYTTSEYTGMATIFQAKLFAIQLDGQYAQAQTDPIVIILSDSQAAIQATTNPLICSRTVKQTIDALNSLCGLGFEVCLQWVQGHNGPDGKEMADFMANKGAILAIEGPDSFLPFASANAKMAEKEALINNWTFYWTNLKQCRQTKLFMPKPDQPLSKKLLNSSKQDVGLLLRNIICHSFFSYHQSLISPGEFIPVCCLCGYIREESCHIIKHCEALAQPRLEYLLQMEVDYFWTEMEILNFLKDPRVYKLLTWDNPPTPTADPDSSTE